LIKLFNLFFEFEILLIIKINLDLTLWNIMQIKEFFSFHLLFHILNLDFPITEIRIHYRIHKNLIIFLNYLNAFNFLNSYLRVQVNKYYDYTPKKNFKMSILQKLKLYYLLLPCNDYEFQSYLKIKFVLNTIQK